jgi:hypothetical protein
MQEKTEVRRILISKEEAPLRLTSRIVYEAMWETTEYDERYSMKDLFYLCKKGADPVLVSFGLPKMNIVGHLGTDILGALDNLWKNGWILKTFTGRYGMSGRPTGVEWIVKWR